MNSAELLAAFRIDVDDLETPYLWADATVYGWIDEAQKQFCRLTYGIEDARSFRLSITVAKEWYVLDPRILKIRSTNDPDTGDEVPLIAYEKMRFHGLRIDGSTGPIKALVTGMEKGKLRAVPVPSVASTVELHTFRLPEDMPLSSADFEIDEQHHRNLLLWIKYRAYSIQDSEVADKKKAVESKLAFENYCFIAKTEQDRMNRPVGYVAYGGY